MVKSTLNYVDMFKATTTYHFSALGYTTTCNNFVFDYMSNICQILNLFAYLSFNFFLCVSRPVLDLSLSA